MEPFDGGRYRRPHYAVGDHVRLLVSGPTWKTGDEAEVTSVDALQTFDGRLVDYLYTLQLPNLVRLKLDEGHVAPLGG